MSTKTHHLAWVIPVAIETLGAHLSAYTKLQPAFVALRLCHRFGDGDKATVARLPRQLVTEIEEIMMQQEREEIRNEWETDLLCYKDGCRPTDHLNEAECVELMKVVTYDETLDMDAVAKLDNFDEDEDEDEDWLNDKLTDERGCQYSCKASHWEQTHEERARRWCDRVPYPPFWDPGFFIKFANLLQSHFRLEIWISTVRDLDPHASGESIRGVQAFLALPSSRETKVSSLLDVKWSPRHGVIISKAEPKEGGAGTAVMMPEMLSLQSQARFKRAMKVLDLEPCEHQKPIRPELMQELENSKESGKAMGEPWPALRFVRLRRQDSKREAVSVR